MQYGSTDQQVAEIRDYYARRRERRIPRVGAALFAARLREYRALFGAVGALPLGGRRIFDAGCCNGGWLALCCTEWGALEDNCVGADLRTEKIAAWRAEHPESRIRLVCGSAHELSFEDGAFDVVHQSMMLSSIPQRELRAQVAGSLWRVLAPGGLLVSYDFWLNPTNRNTVGITRAELLRLFPGACVAFARTVTLAPPLARALQFLGPRAVVALERLRVLNSHYLVALRKT